jgi:hypothetical protein
MQLSLLSSYQYITTYRDMYIFTLKNVLQISILYVP